MDEKRLKEVLESHAEWLRTRFDTEPKGCRANLREADLREANLRGADLRWADLRGADLRGADLREANLRGADLRWADLREANLRGADLRWANLRWADLRGADLREANLRGANLRGADLRWADLRGADLREANLRGADLRWADLREANLRWADLRGADLREANLRGANLREAIGIPLACPEIGEFTGFKKANVKDRGHTVRVIVELRILEDAKRSSATGRKCRCDKAEVLSITSLDGNINYKSAFSSWDNGFTYNVGDIVFIDDFDDDRWEECAPGIHFFITRQEAVGY